jgi:hypothetical protein
MKKLILFLSLVGLTFSILSAQVEPSHMAFIFKKTSIYCNPCGTWGWDLQSKIESDNGGKAVIFQVQIIPTSELYNPAAKEIMDAYNNVTYYPAWFVNGKNRTVESGGGIYPGTTQTAIKKAADSVRTTSPLAACSYLSTLDNGTLIVNAGTQFFADTTGDYYISALLIEKKVTSYQQGIGSDAQHINVLRESLSSSLFGQPVVSGSIKKNNTYSNTFTRKVSPGEDMNRFTLALMLWKKNAGKYSYVNAYKDDKKLGMNDPGVMHFPEISVYPNPVSSLLTISGLNPGTSEIELADLNGKVLVRKHADGNSISFNVSGLPKTLYLLRLSDGIRQEIRKIAVK